MRCTRRTAMGRLVGVPLAFGAAWRAAGAREPAASEAFELVGVRKIWDAAPHCAFTDLLRHDDGWLCVFREGSAHVPGSDGTIRVIASPDGRNWSSAARVALPGVDLRDPKISRMPDGRLMLLMGGSIYSGKEGDRSRSLVGARGRVAFSDDGRTWSAPEMISVEGQWLWRVTWHDRAGYGFGYRIDQRAGTYDFSLWTTTDGRRYDRVVDPKLPEGVLPNETTIRALPDGSLLALVRNEARARRGSALVGFSRRAPFDQWRWVDAGHPAQGPDVLVLPDGRIAYGGRDFPDGARTVLGLLTAEGQARPRLTLPSGGDTSYPGLAWHDGRLWASYYASHEGRTSIYLAEVRLA